jgi:hypothetical protein
MSWKFGTLALFLVVSGAACSSSSGDDGGGSNSGGWKTIDLPTAHIDDEVDAIYYASASSGVIGTVAGEQSSNGAIFSTTATSVTGTAFDGNVSPSAGGLLGGLDFWGFVTTASGALVAVTNAGDLVSAPSPTGTWTDVKNGTGENGTQPAGFYIGASFSLMGNDGNGFAKANGPASPTVTWTDLFDPGSSPTVPNPIPADQCQDAIKLPDSFRSGIGEVAFSADGNTIAYTTYSDADTFPQICISKDGGQTFHPTEFTGKPQGAPSGVIFPKPSAPSTIIAYSGDLVNQDGNYIMRSTDTGATFTPVTLPITGEMQLYGAFFLADGMTGWLVGYEDATSAGLALTTTDGGATWKKDASVTAATSGIKLHSVFALDATHVWLGGENGTFIAKTP